ncbi:MAG: NAD-dependent DNA ligase LigA, partial [Deltaproteobacteria bacterium]|nr:NAD-dependent DNA ligase LigA [Deltaproteobacteria bacterium]
MLPDQAKKIITELTEKINFYSDEYYQKGESSINDNEFDLMLDQLKSLEDQFPDMVLPDSPTSRVGGKPISEFINVRHSIPMLSLGNVYNAEELKDWYQTIIKKIDNRDISWVCEVKIDGFAISIIYENGQFKQAVTRGNGEIGDDVSQNIKTIRSLPLSIKKTESIVVRGEVYLSRERF